MWRLASDLFAGLDAGRVSAVTSELTLAEVLVRPLRDGNTARQRAYEQALSDRPQLRLIPVDRAVLLAAARLRAAGNVRLPDAIHVATACAARCDVLITNDRHLQGRPEIAVSSLEQLLP
jgi:predicted nucleic acid-binding protein